MSSISQRLYNQVMMLDNFTCVYCGKRSADVGIDHIIPQSLNGPNVLENLVACCPSCNSRKKDRGLHQLNNMPSYGRFEHLVRKLRRLQPKKPHEIHRDPRSVEELALLRDERGEYLYSKSRIVRMVGGRRIGVFNRVRIARGEL